MRKKILFCIVLFKSFLNVFTDVRRNVYKIFDQTTQTHYQAMAPDGVVNCADTLTREPTPGIDLIEHSVLPLNPNNLLGDKVFDFEFKSSKSCQRFEYKGVVTIATRSCDKTVKTVRARSAQSLAHSHSISIEASVGVNFAKFGGSAGVGHKSANAQQATSSVNRTWEHQSVTQVDNVISVLKPRLDQTFKELIERECINVTRGLFGQIMDNCMNKLFADRSHYFHSASLGSSLVKVCLFSALFHLCVHWCATFFRAKSEVMFVSTTRIFACICRESSLMANMWFEWTIFSGDCWRDDSVFEPQWEFRGVELDCQCPFNDGHRFNFDNHAKHQTEF